MKTIICLALGCLIIASGPADAQHSMPPGMSYEEHLRQLEKEKALKQRGALAMGFDQDGSTHHFLLSKNGGAIVVVANSDVDLKLTAEIRSHLKEIALAFSEGTFDKPLATHGELPPGSAVMKERSATISYHYLEQPGGGRVVIETKDGVALAAIHEFLRYQITEHKTGDPLTVQ